jgi:ABC-2 type transport system permease protein
MKEFVQMRHDRLTFAMMVGLPLIQIILFGFAINFDPKHLPTAVLSADNSIFARNFIRAWKTAVTFRCCLNPALRPRLNTYWRQEMSSS